MQRKHRKKFPPLMKQSTKLILLTKWLKNTLAELAHEDGQYIVFKTHWIWIWLLSMPVFFTKRLPMRRFLASRRIFIRKLAEELAEPQVKSFKSLALKPQVLENCPVLGSRTALFFKWLKFCRSAEKCFSRPFFFWRPTEKKF